MISSSDERNQLVKNFDQFNIKHSSATIKLFTEKGLYMIATILKSPIATQTTLAIVETFAEVRDLKRTLLEMHDSDSDEFKKKGMVRIGEILGNLIMPDLQATETKTSLQISISINFRELSHQEI